MYNLQRSALNIIFWEDAEISRPLFELTFIEEISLSPSSNVATDKQTGKEIRQHLSLIFRASSLERKDPNEQIISFKDMPV